MMSNTQLEERTNITKDQQVLIKGEFSPEDASEIINHLLTKKIRFHEIRSFSSEIRLGEVDSNSMKRVHELKSSQESINAIIKKAKDAKKNLKISSTISIEII